MEQSSMAWIENYTSFYSYSLDILIETKKTLCNKAAKL